MFEKIKKICYNIIREKMKRSENMEYWTNEEIRSGYMNELIDELKKLQKGIKNSESSI